MNAYLLKSLNYVSRSCAVSYYDARKSYMKVASYSSSYRKVKEGKEREEISSFCFLDIEHFLSLHSFPFFPSALICWIIISCHVVT